MQLVVDTLLTSYEQSSTVSDNIASSIASNKKDKHNPKIDLKEILILHGWGDNSQGWMATRDELAKRYRVTILDLPGFGNSDVPPGAWGLTEYASFVAAFLKKIRLKPYAIVGHSNGGAIAVRGLALGKLHAERLVLLASSGIRSELGGRRKILRVFTKAGKIVAYPLPAALKKTLRRRLYASLGSDLLVAEHMQETFKRIVTDDIQADAAKLKLPTLLIYGEDDTAAPVHYGRILHNLIAGSKLETIEQAGHFVHLDKPDQTRDMLYAFLK